MDVHKLIGKLPRPENGFVLPGHKYTGPYNPLHNQLDENDQPLPGNEPYNAIDEISLHHDICYRDKKNSKSECDEKMLQELEMLNPADFREKLDKNIVKNVIGMKRKLGWGIDPPKTIEWTNMLANELHKPTRKNFPRRKVIAFSPNQIWAADLVEMIPYSRENKGFKYLLTVIDVFSKYGWIIPLKTKTGAEVTAAFKKLFKEAVPAKLWTDAGKEFWNSNMKKLLEENDVKLYKTYNELKSCVIERWNKTIKTDMWKYFTANNSYKYIDILPALVEKYNNSYHHSIKCTPIEAQKLANREMIFTNLYGKKTTKPLPKFKIGDRVRITKKKTIFDKGFTPNWTDEIFTISEIKPTVPVTYTIKDVKGEQLGGSFYEQELQLSHTTTYRIEKVLRRRVRNGQKEEYVKWRGYDSSHNSWNKAS